MGCGSSNELEEKEITKKDDLKNINQNQEITPNKSESNKRINPSSNAKALENSNTQKQKEMNNDKMKLPEKE